MLWNDYFKLSYPDNQNSNNINAGESSIEGTELHLLVNS